LIKFSLRLLRLLLGQGAALACIGNNLCPIDAYRADSFDFHLTHPFQDSGKARFKQLLVVTLKSGDGVMIWVGISSDETDGDVAIGSPLDLAGADHAAAVASNEQSKHHPKRILGATGVPPIVMALLFADEFNSFNNEVGHIICAHPFLAGQSP